VRLAAGCVVLARLAAAGDDPVQPARLTRTIDIDLAEDARLLLAEAIVFGRSGMGER
jgi:urease accessory protein UreH